MFCNSFDRESENIIVFEIHSCSPRFGVGKILMF